MLAGKDAGNGLGDCGGLRVSRGPEVADILRCPRAGNWTLGKAGSNAAGGEVVVPEPGGKSPAERRDFVGRHGWDCFCDLTLKRAPSG